jgi:hypothetical protein
MQISLSRRAVLRIGLTASIVLPAVGLGSFTADAAGSLAPLDPNDPTAQALGFVSDASKVANPTFKPTQKCVTCSQFQGKSTDAIGGCNIFPGKSVPAGGWCKVWVAKA